MNLVSKIKKISACGLASLGILTSTGAVGCSAMYPSAFDFSMMSQMYKKEFEKQRERREREGNQDIGQNFTLNFNNFGLPTNRERFPMSQPTNARNKASRNANSENSFLSFVSLNGRNTRTLNEREKIELTRRGIALLDKGESYASVARKLGISDSTLKNWEIDYGDGVARYTSQERKEHVFRYLREQTLSPSVNVTDYANRNGLVVATFRNWVRDYQAGRLK